MTIKDNDYKDFEQYLTINQEKKQNYQKYLNDDEKKMIENDTQLKDYIGDVYVMQKYCLKNTPDEFMFNKNKSHSLIEYLKLLLYYLSKHEMSTLSECKAIEKLLDDASKETNMWEKQFNNFSSKDFAKILFF